MQRGGGEDAFSSTTSSAAWLFLVSSPPQLIFTLLLLLLAILLLSSSYHYLTSAGSSSYGGRKLPPGSFGLPLGLGETLQFAFNNTCPIGCPPPFLSSRLRKYGMVFKTHLLGRPTVVSMDPELNKMLLSNEEKLVQANFPNFIKKIVGPLLTEHGARHRRFREIATNILSPVAIQNVHLNSVQEHIRSTIRSWSKMFIVDAQQESRKLIFTYIARSFLSLTPEDHNTQLLMKNFFNLLNGYASIPLNLPGTTYNKVLRARKKIITTLVNLIQARRKTRPVQQQDFIDMLLMELNDKDFTEHDLAEYIFFLVFGASDTSSVLLTNVIKFLSENAHVVEELRKEHKFLRRNKKESDLLAWEDFKQMQFTDLVIKESLRMASIVHFVTREAIQDIYFKDMVIPKGWTTLISFSMVHLNEKFFQNPLKFDPWRWKDSENNRHGVLMAFGGGIRSCLGSFLAKFEVSVFIHYLVTSYKWERITKSSAHVDVVSSLSLPTMKKGLKIKVEPL